MSDDFDDFDDDFSGGDEFEFEFELVPETRIDFQWMSEDEEEFMLLRVENDLLEDGYVFQLDEDTCVDLYNFLRKKFESKIN